MHEVEAEIHVDEVLSMVDAVNYSQEGHVNLNLEAWKHIYHQKPL